MPGTDSSPRAFDRILVLKTISQIFLKPKSTLSDCTSIPAIAHVNTVNVPTNQQLRALKAHAINHHSCANKPGNPAG